MSFRLAAVQPRSYTGADEVRNIDHAVDWMERAHAEGAELVMFPEGYPGPTNPDSHFDALPVLSAKAAALGLHVVAGSIEPAGRGRHYVVLHLIDDRGVVAAPYRRTTPLGPYIYRDIPTWGFEYEAAADEPLIFDTRLGRIGLLVCSEVYVPELARGLALKGADTILFPAGGAINELLPTWRTMVWARAIENLVYTAAVQNLYADDEVGVGIVAAPERVLAHSGAETLLIADLDSERLAFLRSREERIEFPKPYQTIPGLMRWRRPELYESLCAPRPNHDAPC
jgi:predicted amidohydrolase